MHAPPLASRTDGVSAWALGLVPPLLLEAPKRATKLCVFMQRLALNDQFSCAHMMSFSAANDFWGKTVMNATGEKKMTQNLSILTGCLAGGTESFVVVPFELVKIK